MTTTARTLTCLTLSLLFAGCATSPPAADMPDPPAPTGAADAYPGPAPAGPDAAPEAPEPPPSYPSAPPEPTQLEPVDFPEFQRYTLDNGASVVVVEQHEQPMVTVGLRIRSGAVADPADEIGLASMTATLLDNGTETRSAEEIAQTIDFIGASFGAGAADEWSGLFLTVPTPFLETGLEVMSDVVLHPVFPEDEVDNLRQRRLSSLKLSLSQPRAIASRRFTSAIYGEHPYGDLTSEDTYQAIERSDLVEFYRSHYRPGNALFVVAGDVEPARIIERLNRAFAEWQPEPVPEQDHPAPPAPERRTLIFVHKPATAQTVFRLGHLLPPASNDDWVELAVMNKVLGGGVGGWFFEILRDEKGYTYGAYTSAVAKRGSGYFSARTSARNAVADSTLATMLDLLERIRTEGVPREDLIAAKSDITGSFPLTIETPEGVARQIVGTLLLGRPLEYLMSYRQRVSEVTTADVRRVAREYLHPDRMTVVAVGDATQVLDDLRPYVDAVELYDVQGEPLALEDLTVEASTVAFDPSAIEPVTLTYSVSVRGRAIGDATTTVTRETVDGREAIRAITSLAFGPVSTEQAVVFGAESFTPISYESRAQRGPMTINNDLRFENGRIVGTVSLPNRATGQVEEKEVDAAVPGGTLLPGMQDYALWVTDWPTTEPLEIPVFNPRSTSAMTVTFAMTGDTTITTPAGQFETWVVEAQGAQGTSTLYLRKEAPHIVLRRERAAPPIVVELKSIE